MEHTVGNRVRGVRRARDLTQAQLAAMTGLNVITISRLENGTAKSIHGDTIVALARALGISADYLLGLAEPQSVTDTVTDTSHLRCLLDHDLRALKAGTVADPTQILLRLQRELRAFLAYAQSFVSQAEGVIDAIDTAEQRTGTGAVETPRVTDTVTDAESVTDTVTVTGHTTEPFDTSKFYLGKLCPRGHAFSDTGQSLLRKHNQRCRECENESRREKRQAKREAQPVAG